MSKNLPKVLVFGAGAGAASLLPFIERDYHITAFLDNDESKWNSSIEGIPVCNPEIIHKADYQKIVLASSKQMENIISQLLDMGVSFGDIDWKLACLAALPRILFLEKLGEMLKGTQGATAEAGVFQGDFAKEINRVFRDRTLYLFDSFTGFHVQDLEDEVTQGFSLKEPGLFSQTSEELVLEKMPYPEKCVVKKGYFPDTAWGLEEKFAFVSLDLDLYKPTLGGLEYFYPRMSKNGVIVIHDYFSEEYKGVKEAVGRFWLSHPELKILPVGDLFSAAVFC
ncbi:MAG: hypothetical protein FWG82_03635 [Oscillospiraceae bacterium]|nr:hypothetical protein [Oscillospiraceae bacterium]